MWRERFQRASFRGVAFETENRDLSGGRRMITHLYPKRDEPNPEDMGRAPRNISVQGYLFGPDYLDAKERLIAALEREGTGEYVDAWGRAHEVVVLSWSCREQEKTGGHVSFRMSFLEAGKQRGHTNAPDTAGAVRGLAALHRAGAIVRFAGAWIAAVGGAPALLCRTVLRVAESLGINALREYAAQIVALPNSLGQHLLALLAASGNPADLRELWAHSGNLASSPDQSAHALARLVDLAPGDARARTARYLDLAGAAFAGGLAGDGKTARVSMPADADNAASLHTLTARLALAAAASAMADTAFFTAEEARATGFAISDGLGALRGRADAREYQEIATLRAALVEDMHIRAARLPELCAVPTGQSMPALVQAYKLYGTAAKEAELLRLNASIIHPGFVPGGSSVYMLKKN